LFAFPLWWLLSVVWGAETGLILKSGAQFVLTLIICYCAIHRLNRRHVMLSRLFSAGLFGVLSILSDGSGGVAARGVFSSKNAMGGAMVILWIAALSTLFDQRFKLSIRLIALVLLAVSVRMIIVSNSATAQLVAIGVTCVILVIGVIGRRGLGHPRFVLPACMTMAAACLGAAYFLSTRDVDFIAKVLDSFGKDASLTGRTQLWDYAMAEITRTPWLGLGQGGFWTPLDWTSEARRIYIDYHKNFYSNFSFHNSFLEVTVHLGLIGLAIAVTTTLWAIGNVAFSALRDPSIPKVFFLSMGLVTLARSTTESGLMAPFSLMTMVLIIGALFTVKDRISNTAQGHAS
jgi:exopolysaccharide production protein ExoQ